MIALDLTVNLAAILGVCSLLFGWVRLQLKAMRDGFDIAKDERRDLDKRLAAVERTVESLPGQKDVHGMQLTMSEVRGELREMRAVMAGNSQIMARLENIVTRHEDHLLEGKR